MSQCAFKSIRSSAVAILLVGVLFGPYPSRCFSYNDTPGYIIVFADEFDGAALNTDIWDFESGYIRNNELQYYVNSSNNVNLTNGSLWITATNERVPLPDGQTPFCRSGSIFSRQNFRYGIFEMRARLPGGKGNGTWPAFWLLGANIATVGWPTCGEIDIMENVGYIPERLFVTLHDHDFNSIIGNQIGTSIEVPTMYNDFNIYGVIWTSTSIQFYVNNVTVMTYLNNMKCNPDSWPYFAPFQIKLNLAIGGTWGGIGGVDPSIFPAAYEIDYVRVYQNASDVPPPCGVSGPSSSLSTADIALITTGTVVGVVTASVLVIFLKRHCYPTVIAEASMTLH